MAAIRRKIPPWRSPRLLMPRFWMMARWLRLKANFCRRISRVWRMDNRSVAIHPYLLDMSVARKGVGADATRDQEWELQAACAR